MRCLAIAEESTSRGIPTFLIGKVENLSWLTDRVMSIPNLTWFDESSDFLPNSATDSLIIDSYTISTADSFVDVSKWYQIISIVDENTPDYKSRIRIHPGLDISWSKDKEIVFGPKYIPLRKNISKTISNENAKLRIIAVGGGTNYKDFVEVVAGRLELFDLDFKAHLFSDSWPQKKLADSRFLFEPIGERLDYIAGISDLILTTASTTCLEFVAREKAIGMLCAVDNQNTYYEILSKLELACPLGRFVGGNWNVDQNLLRELVYSQDYRSQLRSRARDFIDLQGASRIMDMICAEYP
jgi:spore coat polysaccharide biosynthesis predicted glycosyltransferase SpsG